MGKLAFVFPGQGAQYVGMGRDFYENSMSAKQIFDYAELIRPGTQEQCFFGSEEALCQTENAQPCLFTVEMAAAAFLADIGIHAELTAGFSVGEIAALTYAGAVPPEVGFRLVCRRAILMQQSAAKNPASMVAVLRMEHHEIERICASFKQVYPVNYNSPGQVAVSGAVDELPAFCKAVKDAGGRSVPLKVSTGFHSPFMAEASIAFANELRFFAVSKGAIPLYSNYTGRRYAGNPRELLAKQVSNPVRWEAVIRNMIADGADTFVELGPGHTLAGLIEKIDPSVLTFSIAKPADAEAILAEVGSC